MAGLCTYGHRCINRHPSQAEADAVRATYKEKTCSYGDDCQTEGCLYWHPWEAAEAVDEAEYAGEICEGVGGLHLDGSPNAGIPVYEQWLLLNCPAPPTMDKSLAYNIWHYPGSGMQRAPWDVYCLMYPQGFTNTTLTATTQRWEPESNNAHTLPQSWEPINNGTQIQSNDDPKTFQEWKKKGQPYPHWFCSDLDPWYDDEGVRRSLEEVFEVLYGEHAQENYDRKLQAQRIANDPTPAELAAMLNANDPIRSHLPVTKEPTSTKFGWASIAAKPPAPFQKQSVTGISSNSSYVFSSTSTADDRSASNEQKRGTVVIPKEVWLPTTANADCFHLYPNPIERFKAVNNHHKSYLASVAIPLSFDNYNINGINTGSSPNIKDKVAVLDVHFQSAKTIAPVLNRFLAPALKKNDEVWIITGSGHHVAVGHQRREGGGVLFNAVKRYLEEHEDELALEFRIGKDTSGGKNKSSGGALLVRKTTVQQACN